MAPKELNSRKPLKQKSNTKQFLYLTILKKYCILISTVVVVAADADDDANNDDDFVVIDDDNDDDRIYFFYSTKQNTCMYYMYSSVIHNSVYNTSRRLSVCLYIRLRAAQSKITELQIRGNTGYFSIIFIENQH